MILYQRNDRNQWERKQIITPPEDNTIEPVDVGFGHAIDLYDKQIAISSYNYLALTKQERNKSQDNLGQIYWGVINQENKVEINSIKIPKLNLIVGYNVGFFDQNIIFSIEPNLLNVDSSKLENYTKYRKLGNFLIFDPQKIQITLFVLFTHLIPHRKIKKINSYHLMGSHKC